MTDRLSSLVRRLTILAFWLGAGAFLLAGLIVFYEVVARKLFLAPTSWGIESAEVLQVWAVYLAAAGTLARRGFIAVDYGPKRETTTLAAAIAVPLASLFLLIVGADLVWNAVAFGWTSPGMVPLPFWATELALPTGALLLICQSLAGRGDKAC